MKRLFFIILLIYFLPQFSFTQTKAVVPLIGFATDASEDERASTNQVPVVGIAYRMTNEYGHFHQIGLQQLWFKKTSNPFDDITEYQAAIQYTFGANVLDIGRSGSILVGGYGALKYQYFDFAPLISSSFPEQDREYGLEVGGYAEFRLEIGRNSFFSLQLPFKMGSFFGFRNENRDPSLTRRQQVSEGFDLDIAPLDEGGVFLAWGWKFN